MPACSRDFKPVTRPRTVQNIARRKSDADDVFVLPHLLCTDMAAHGSLPWNSEQLAVAVLARAQQDPAWDKVIAHIRLCAVLHEYYRRSSKSSPTSAAALSTQGQSTAGSSPIPTLEGRGANADEARSVVRPRTSIAVAEETVSPR